MVARSSCWIAACALVALAGCGESHARRASVGSTSPPTTESTTADTSPGSSPTIPRATSPAASPTPVDRVPTAGSQDFSVPPAARGKGVKRVAVRHGLALSSPASATTPWRLRARSTDGDVLCVDVHSQGVTDPAPLCNSGTQLAIEFFTDQTQGHALADVNAIAASKGAKPTDLVVAGVAAPDVKDVVVDFHGAEHAAAVSGDAVTLPVDKHLAKEILDPTAAQLRSLPSRVTVRVFAVSMPAEVRNPPTTATPRTATPVHGRMTFDLS